MAFRPDITALAIKALNGGGGGEGGTSNYNDLSNRPQVNGNTLMGNKTGAQLGLVDAEDGKGLSDENYTAAEKTKLSGIGTGAQVNVIEKITVNGTEQAITDKTVALTVITETVNNLVNYYTKTQTYTQDEVNALVSAAASGGFEVVETLPVLNIDPKKIYLVAKDPVGEAGDLYDEYIYVNEKWEHIGSTSIDLTAYQTKNLSADITVDGVAQTTVEGALAAINAALANYLTTSAFNTQIASYYTKTQTDTLITNAVGALAETVAEEIGDLDDLVTTEKGNLVGAINEAAQSGGVTVDDEISGTSENPVQNKVIKVALDEKVDKEIGKGLSTNDYDDAAKAIVDGVTAALGSKADKTTVGDLDDLNTTLKTDIVTAINEVNVQRNGALATGTLTAAGWSNNQQTVSVAGVLSSNIGAIGLTDSATDTQIQAAAVAQIKPTAVGNGTITFSCVNTPSIDIPFGVLIGGGPLYVAVTLAAASWSNKAQTVNVTGVTASSNGSFGLAGTATTAQRTAAGMADISLSSVGTGTMTFTCQNVPSVDIPLVIEIAS